MRAATPATTVEVVLRFVRRDAHEPSAVEVEVIDDGRLVDAPDPGSSGGFGLTGIRERAAMHGGQCEIGPRPQGGFRVRVRIPAAP
jgi:signal transduction histidine kinase